MKSVKPSCETRTFTSPGSRPETLIAPSAVTDSRGTLLMNTWLPEGAPLTTKTKPELAEAPGRRTMNRIAAITASARTPPSQTHFALRRSGFVTT